MNYRHIYHAGNFADVVKHAVLAMVIARLQQKEAPLRVIDTHAGIGSYDLEAAAALKTGEWRAGIGRLLGPEAAPLPHRDAQLLAPYLEAVRALNGPGALTRYPGSPMLARALLRPQDRMVVNELHPADAHELAQTFARDAQVKVMQLSGWTALKALLPPPERRGVVLIDPPFEEKGELERLVKALQEGVRRFATGVYLLWYPIKDRHEIDRFHRALVATGIPRLLAAELMIRGEQNPDILNGTGLIVHNPPWQLDRAVAKLLAFLAPRLEQEPGGSWKLDTLSGEPGEPSRRH